MDDHTRATTAPLVATILPRNLDLARLSRHIALGEFAASMGHEVRQPLTVILANAETSLRLLRSASPDVAEVVAALEEVVEAGYRVDQLIRRNHDLLRNLPPQREPLDLNGVLGEVLSLADARLQGAGVSVRTSLAALPAIDCDRHQLQHLLLSVISNAVEAMEPQERAARVLDITTRVTTGGAAQILIADTGVGFDGVDPDRLFTPYYTTKTTGLGVGLSIGRAIAEAHGGTLQAEPNGAAGACFSLTLPAGAAKIAGGHAYP
jgi:signal transduction histidine kinase